MQLFTKISARFRTTKPGVSIHKNTRWNTKLNPSHTQKKTKLQACFLFSHLPLAFQYRLPCFWWNHSYCAQPNRKSRGRISHEESRASFRGSWMLLRRGLNFNFVVSATPLGSRTGQSCPSSNAARWQGLILDTTTTFDSSSWGQGRSQASWQAARSIVLHQFML